jgi:hypothetical protein
MYSVLLEARQLQPPADTTAPGAPSGLRIVSN